MPSSKSSKKWKDIVLEDLLKSGQITEGSICKFQEKISRPSNPDDVPLRRERIFERTVYKTSNIGKKAKKAPSEKEVKIENSNILPVKSELIAEIDKYLTHLQCQRKHLQLAANSQQNQLWSQQLAAQESESRKKDSSEKQFKLKSPKKCETNSEPIFDALKMLLQKNCVKVSDSATQIGSPTEKKTKRKEKDFVQLSSDTSSINILWIKGKNSRRSSIKMVHSSTQVERSIRKPSKVKMVNSCTQVGPSLRGNKKDFGKKKKYASPDTSTSNTTRQRMTACDALEFVKRLPALESERNSRITCKQCSDKLPTFFSGDEAKRKDLKVKNNDPSPRSKTLARTHKKDFVETRLSKITNRTVHRPKERDSSTIIQRSPHRNQLSMNKNVQSVAVAKHFDSSLCSESPLQIIRISKGKTKIKESHSDRNSHVVLSSTTEFVESHRTSQGTHSQSPKPKKWKSSKNGRTKRKSLVLSPNAIDNRTYTIPDDDENGKYIVLPYVHVSNDTELSSPVFSRKHVYKIHQTSNYSGSQGELSSSVIEKSAIILEDASSQESKMNSSIRFRSRQLKRQEPVQSNLAKLKSLRNSVVNPPKLPRSFKNSTLSQISQKSKYSTSIAQHSKQNHLRERINDYFEGSQQSETNFSNTPQKSLEKSTHQSQRTKQDSVTLKSEAEEPSYKKRATRISAKSTSMLTQPRLSETECSPSQIGKNKASITPRSLKHDFEDKSNFKIKNDRDVPSSSSTQSNLAEMKQRHLGPNIASVTSRSMKPSKNERNYVKTRNDRSISIPSFILIQSHLTEFEDRQLGKSKTSISPLPDKSEKSAPLKHDLKDMSSGKKLSQSDQEYKVNSNQINKLTSSKAKNQQNLNGTILTHSDETDDSSQLNQIKLKLVNDQSIDKANKSGLNQSKTAVLNLELEDCTTKSETEIFKTVNINNREHLLMSETDNETKQHSRQVSNIKEERNSIKYGTKSRSKQVDAKKYRNSLESNTESKGQNDERNSIKTPCSSTFRQQDFKKESNSIKFLEGSAKELPRTTASDFKHTFHHIEPKATYSEIKVSTSYNEPDQTCKHEIDVKMSKNDIHLSKPNEFPKIDFDDSFSLELKPSEPAFDKSNRPKESSSQNRGDLSESKHLNDPIEGIDLELQNRLRDADNMVQTQMEQKSTSRCSEFCNLETLDIGREEINKSFIVKMESEVDEFKVPLVDKKITSESELELEVSCCCCRYGEEQSTSYYSDVPPYYGCECMKGDYYKIMELAYNI